MARNPRELTLVEAARLLGVTSATLRAQSRKGRLATFKRGRDRYVLLNELERYRWSVQRRGQAAGADGIQTPKARTPRANRDDLSAWLPRLLSQLPPGRRPAFMRLVRAATAVAATNDTRTRIEAIAASRSREMLDELVAELLPPVEGS